MTRNQIEIYNRKPGLTRTEVEKSRLHFGKNTLSESKRNSFWKDLINNFKDPIIKILLCALGANLIFMFRSFNVYESAGIVFAILLATVISTVSERGSELAFEKLKEETAKGNCRVKRANGIVSIPLTEIVVGDIILLSAGEMIPADGTVIDGELSVDQSALNGESKEVQKTTAKTPSTSWDLSHRDQVFRGSIACSGECVIEVGRVGNTTFYGTVANELQESKRESPLKVRLAKLAEIISNIGYVCAALVAFASLFDAFVLESAFDTQQILLKITNLHILMPELLRAFTLAITVIVVAVPEGLPMMITVVLSSNMNKMLKDNVLVRKLVGIETAGSLNLLFTDKTGTLTSGKFSVDKVFLGDGSEFACNAQLKKKKIYELFSMSAIFNTGSIVSGKSVLGGNATDRAILDYTLPNSVPKGCIVVSKIPFDSSKKYSAAQITRGNQTFRFIKGAPELILGRADRYLDCDGTICDMYSQKVIKDKWMAQAKSAGRVIAIAMSEQDLNGKTIPDRLIFIALVVIKDKVRREAKDAVRQIQNAGVQVVMLTGDNKETANAIANECGIMRPNQNNISLTSEELAKMDDEKLKDLLPNLCVVARALPTDKTRLVKIAQSRELVVGMTGDGINDAPALKKSDVGFAMGSGTAVAKEAGDIVILDNNFASIVKAVLYGRTIFKSIRKFIMFQLTMNLCAVGVTLIGPFIGVDTPVTVLQMLWINIIMDTLGGLAFAGEPALQEYMNEKPKARSCPILNSYMLSQILSMGIFTIALCIAFLKVDAVKTYFHYEYNPLYFMTAFFAVFIFSGIFNCFNTRTYRVNVTADLFKNQPFVLIMTGIVIVQIVLMYYGGTVFRTIGLPIRDLVTVLAISFVVIPFDVAVKLFNKKIGFERSV